MFILRFIKTHKFPIECTSPIGWNERNIICSHYEVQRYSDSDIKDITVYPGLTKTEGITWRVTNNTSKEFNELEELDREYYQSIFVMNSDGKTIDRLF